MEIVIIIHSRAKISSTLSGILDISPKLAPACLSFAIPSVPYCTGHSLCLIDLPLRRAIPHTSSNDRFAATKQTCILLLRLLVPTSDILIPVRLRRVLCYYKAKIRWEVFKGVDDIFRNECEMAQVT